MAGSASPVGFQRARQARCKHDLMTLIKVGCVRGGPAVGVGPGTRTLRPSQMLWLRELHLQDETCEVVDLYVGSTARLLQRMSGVTSGKLKIVELKCELLLR